MPTIDKRNVIEHLHTGGSDVGLQVFLSAAEAQQVYGAAAVAGWYTFGTFEGGTIAYRVEAQDDKDEADQLTGKTIEQSAEFVLTNQIKETDDATQDLIDDVLTQRFHKYRYALPFGQSASGEPLHQVYGIERGKVSPGFEMQTGAGQKRLRPFELKASRYQGAPAFVRKTVDLTDEASWPPVLDAFKTA